MPNENGEWIIRGLAKNDPNRVKSPQELIKVINKVGFMPLFANSVEGFSVEEMTWGNYWWSGDEKNDPWEWRITLTNSKKVVYGKFFDKKAGFISLKWFPYFANWKRDGYDFDALWDDQKANYRQKKIMDLFELKDEYFSYEMKEAAGFGKNGEKNFDGILTSLQMQTYLIPKDFKQKVNKKGEAYGWHVAVMSTPEIIFGKDFARNKYDEDPQVSKEKIYKQIMKCYPDAKLSEVKKILK